MNIVYEYEVIKDYLKVKHALYNGDFKKFTAEKIFRRLGRKTEIVALINGINPLEVTDDMLDDCE